MDWFFSFLQWLYDRWGQMVCFGFGGGMVSQGASDGNPYYIGGGAALLLTGLGLKAIFTARQIAEFNKRD